MDVALATRPGDGLALERHDPQVVGQSAARHRRVQAAREFRVLGRDARWILSLVPVVVGAGRGAQALIIFFVDRVVVAQGDQCCGPNGHCISAEGQALGHVSSVSNAARNDELHLPVHVQFNESIDRGTYRREGRDTHVLDEDILGSRGTALHPINHHHVCPCFYRERRVVVGACRSHLYKDGLLPASQFA